MSMSMSMCMLSRLIVPRYGIYGVAAV